MYFRKYRLRKIWLDNCVKSRVSEDPEADNTKNGWKHCSNMKNSAFRIIINHCEGSSIGRSLL